MRRLVAEKCVWVKITPSASAISNCSQELSRRINPGHRTTQRGQRTSEFNGKRRPKAKEVVDSPGQGPERLQPVRKRLPRIIDHREAEGVTNTFDVWGSAGGGPDWNGSRSPTSWATPPHTEFKDSDRVEHRQLDP
jgi:hypothetical protein